jgi:hypothetical protein
MEWRVNVMECDEGGLLSDTPERSVGPGPFDFRLYKSNLCKGLTISWLFKCRRAPKWSLGSKATAT